MACRFRLFRPPHLPLTSRALPATLLVGIGCVLISRFAGFQPGYLYGLIVAFMFAGVTFDHEGPARATAAGISLGAAFVAWVALAFIRGRPSRPTRSLAR